MEAWTVSSVPAAADSSAEPTHTPARSDSPVWRLDWLTPFRCRLLFAAVVAFGFFSHIRYLTHDCPIGLSGDEADYWDWSRQLDWSYYSKGPLVAYLIRLSCWAFGRDSMLAVRFPALVLGAGTSIVTYLLARKLFRSDRVALGTVLLYHVVPMFVAGSMLMTIDPPYFFCWALATYLLAHAVFDGRRWVWPVIGVVAGVGFLAKYAMLLWFLPTLVFLATDRPSRPLLKVGRFWLAFAVSLLFLTPVVVWNAQHHWVSLHHVATQTGTSSEGKLRLGNVAEFLGSQVGVIGPGLFVIMAAAVLYAARPWGERSREAIERPLQVDVPPRDGTLDYERPVAAHPWHDRLSALGSALRSAFHRVLLPISPAAPQPEPHARQIRFLMWFGVLFFGLTFLSSFRTKVQVNWPAPAYFTLMILTAYFLSTRLKSLQTWKPWRWWFYPAVGFGLAMMPLAHNIEVLYPAVRWANAHAARWRQQKSNPILAWLGKRVPKNGFDTRQFDFTAKLKGWDEFGDQLSRDIQTMGPDAFVMCDDYQTASELAFSMKGQPKTYCAGSYFPTDPKRWTQFDLWPDRALDPASPRVGQNALFVGHTNRPFPDLLNAFDRVEGVTVQGQRRVNGQWVPTPQQVSLDLQIARDGLPVRTFRYFKCYGFKGMARPQAKQTY